MIGSAAVNLDHLSGIEIALCRDPLEIRREFPIVADGNVATAAGCRRFFQVVKDICDPPLELDRGNGERFVINAQRTDRRHGFDHAVDLECVEPSSKSQHSRADVQIDLVAEVDNKRGIAGGEHIVIGHDAAPSRVSEAGRNGALDCSLSGGLRPA